LQLYELQGRAGDAANKLPELKTQPQEYQRTENTRIRCSLPLVGRKHVNTDLQLKRASGAIWARLSITLLAGRDGRARVKMLITISRISVLRRAGLDLSPIFEAPASYNLYGILIERFGDQFFGRVAENVITHPPAANLLFADLQQNLHAQWPNPVEV